jgi:YegS/Rv2252/BmrU family lipid kinase
MKKTIQFIINPISGIGKKNILPGLIDKYLDKAIFDYKIVYTKERGHAKELTQKAVENNVDVVCAVGGDGSVNEVGSVLANRNTVLAILPTGSGNGLARHLGLPLKLKKAIKNINKFEYKLIDTVSINDMTFLSVAGFGFDALVANKFDQYHSRGFLSYAKLVMKEFRNYKGISITINKSEKFDSLLFCSFANASQFGNGFTISPNSNTTDGQFEIVCIELPRLFGFIVLLTRSFFGTIHKSSKYHVFKVKHASISASNTMAHIDGEPLNIDSAQVDLTCNPAQLKIII